MHNNYIILFTTKITSKINMIAIYVQAWILLSDIPCGWVYKPEYYCQTSPVDKCTFCITFSFKSDGYTESTLIHRGCPAVMFRLGVVSVTFSFKAEGYTENTPIYRKGISGSNIQAWFRLLLYIIFYCYLLIVFHFCFYFYHFLEKH